jgi:NarL family two-component system response regulator LiaR
MPGNSHLPTDPPAGTAGASGADSALRVMIVDDEELFRAGLRSMLEVAGVRVVGEAARPEEALEIVPGSRPDVVVLSLDARGMPATEATRRLVRVAPGTGVLALTGGQDPDAVIDALVAGATGYLAKGESEKIRAADAVRAAAAGELVLAGDTARAAVERLRRLSAVHEAADGIRATLSERELDVLRLLVDGKDNGEIGAALFISAMTVKHHVKAICRKLGADNRTQAAVRAVRAGIV